MSTTSLTYQDYLAFPSDCWRHEVLAGEHVVSPRPDLRHQRTALRLLLQLEPQVTERGLGLVLPDVTVQLGRHQVVEPDITVLLPEHLDRAAKTRVIGAPDLVVEILSPNNRSHDCEQKRGIYAAHGVAEYWIVDPDQRTVAQLLLRGDSYVHAATATTAIISAVLPGVTIDLQKVW